MGQKRATKAREYDLLQTRVGHKRTTRPGGTICYGKEWSRNSNQDPKYGLLRIRAGQTEPPRLGSTICYGKECARKSHQDLGVRLVTGKSGPERATKTWDLLRIRVGQKQSALAPHRWRGAPRDWPIAICGSDELACPAEDEDRSAIR